MKKKEVIDYIVNWLNSYAESSKTKGFVVGISGGIDSALTSTLCAETGKPLIVLNMPIRQFKKEFDLSNAHINWLKKNYNNVRSHTVELTPVFDSFEQQLPEETRDFLSMANSRSRLRMTTLYAFACHHQMLVAGTGNKIEDFGVGFFTKYGDGGVDVSPIADLMKSEVYSLAKELNVIDEILAARPTDGLFEDGRTDEDQLGASYDELEWAMMNSDFTITDSLNERQKTVLEIYKNFHRKNQHKMQPIPVCILPENLR
jgi:NAD+ synthase